MAQGRDVIVADRRNFGLGSHGLLAAPSRGSLRIGGPQVTRQSGDVGRVEERYDVDVLAQLALELVDQERRLERIAAELEEIVADSDAVAAE